MTEEEQAEFWRRRREARERLDKKMGKLPYEKKLKIAGKMRANHEALRNAKLIEPLLEEEK